MKLRKLHIENYKMFKDFDISFLDENDEALPIIVLVGVNGSGKTTLLEFIKEFFEYEKNKLLFESQGKIFGLGGTLSFGWSINTSGIKNHDDIKSILSKNTRIDNTVYLPAGQDNIIDLKEAILEHYRRLVRESSHLKALKEIQNFLNTIFTEDMEITFTIDDIDIVVRDKEKVIFKNTSGNTFNIDKLSTGEKTLLSKVLYLFFKDYKDKVILIDEPELSLHPSWQNKVLKIYENFAKANNCQIIIATHSPHIIGAAKNEYLRILRKNNEGNIEVVDDLLAYGRDIEWVLEEVMGTDYIRNKKILDKIEVCQDFIAEEKYGDAEEAIDNLEAIIGANDSEILTLRNNLAFERMDFEEDN